MPKNRSFTLRATASRLAKGLLAIPRKFSAWFPHEKGKIAVIFDDGVRVETKQYLPYDPRVKESRIFGLGRWFSKRDVKPGELITITVADEDNRVFRIALDRYVQQRQERRIRQELLAAPSEAVARGQLYALARIVKKRPRVAAYEELLRVARESAYQSRARVRAIASDRHEGVPAGLRVLLGTLHEGKCQCCSFTFTKRDGEPYFEMHHIDPQRGHHPLNLLLLCPNCHAQFEHATVTDFQRVAGWLVAVKINGKRVPLGQPLSRWPSVQAGLALYVLMGGMQAALHSLRISLV